MKKQLSKIALGLALFSALPGFSQEPKILPCETFAAMEEHFAKDPAARSTYEALESALQARIAEERNNAAKTVSAFEYTIPVVFHILHTGGLENISDATCQAAIDWVNKDLARQNSDTSTIASIYKPLYIPSDIKLMLARKDKNGKCVSGIVHRYDPRTVWDRSGNLNLLYSGITTDFPTSKYLNIIIVKEIVSANATPGSIVVGYTYKPNSWGTDAPQDAIVYRYDYLAGSKSRSLTHELGHWLSLDHTFGATNDPGINCGDDGLPDTPPTKGNFSQCPSSLSGNSCAGSGGKTNVENIMDYSNCPKNFTADQTSAMRSTLANVGKRQSLWSSLNITNTNVNNQGFCAPIAEYLSSTNTYTVCAGGSITMKDLSYNGPVTSYTWTADNNAIVASPSASTTSVVFPSIGTANVILTVSNSQGTSTKARTVLVLDNTAGIVGPHKESFEAMGVPQDWLVVNPDAGSTGWERTDWTGYDGYASFHLNTSANPANQVDYFQTPIIDLLNSPNPKVEFAYAYAKQTTGHNDKFKVQASTDCAATWIDLMELSANQMYPNSGGVQSAPFYPAIEDEWKKIDLSTYATSAGKWSSIKTSPNVILRFTFTQGPVANGNNIFVDAINLPVASTSTVNTGMSEFRKDLQMSIYPNPTQSSASVSFRLHDAAVVGVSVVDILGKEVIAVPAAKLATGEHSIQLNERLAPGVYNVNLSVNGTSASTKLIVQ